MPSHRLLLAAAALVGAAAQPAPEEPATNTAVAHPTAPVGAVFFENFDSEDGITLSDFADYQGQSVGVRALETSAFDDDKSLVLEEDAHRYGVTLPVDSTGADASGDFVLQYEVRLSNSLECGGAYLKLLDANNLPEGGNVTPDSPYIIMFGPDRCGDNNKVHFILRHQNPVSKEWEEKHYAPDSPLTIQSDKFSHLYTLVVRPDNSFTIKVDSAVVKTGNLLENMQPPINPEKQIDDPDDKKPTDWVDDAQIPDPAASKPDDWDEDAPKTILDEDASMPDGWLEDEKYLIPDPAAEIPEEWDEEEDGEFEAPVIQNPKCASAPGCEPWKRPTIENPAYKGKWSAPLIDNPDYVGEWSPRKIENPNYFVDNSPADGLVSSVGAVGVEVWIHKHGGIAFDNILIGTDEEAAAALAMSTFEVKRGLERANDSELERQRRHERNLKYLEEGGIFGRVQYHAAETIDLAREWPILFAAGGLAVVVALVVLCCKTCCKEEELEYELPEGPAAAAPTATASAAASEATPDGEEDGDDEDDAPAVAQPTGGDGDDDDDDDAPSLDKSPQAKKDD